MIEIKVVKDDVTIKGHANYVKTGDDIVCAAVSTLLQSMILGIEKLTDEKINYQLKSGDSYFEAPSKSHEAILLYHNFIISASEIAEQYPENVKLDLTEMYKLE